jgi:hypothetical protein
MSSRSFETRSRPRFLAATLAALPSISLVPFARLKLGRVPACSPLPIAALPSMSLSPNAPFPDSRRVDSPLAQLRTATLRGLTVYPSASQRDVFYVADPISSIVSRLLPQRSTATSRLYRPCRPPQSLHSTRRVQETVQSRQDVARTSTLRERSSQHYERTN